MTQFIIAQRNYGKFSTGDDVLFVDETTECGGRWVYEHLTKIVFGFKGRWEVMQEDEEVIVMNDEWKIMKNVCF